MEGATETKIGMAVLVETTNEKFKCYQGRKGLLTKIANPEDPKMFLYFFDMVKYFIRTSLVHSVDYGNSSTKGCTMTVKTMNSVYVFELSFSEEGFTIEEFVHTIREK